MKSLAISILVFLISCDIFDVLTLTDPKDLSKLSISYDNKRITDLLLIPLSWDEITFENFKDIKIERYNEHRDSLTYPVGTSNNGWIPILSTDNPFTTTWVDTIYDDAVFNYRLRYYNKEFNFYQTENSVTIRPTTHVFIPIEFLTVEKALESYVLDEGDTIFICMNEFETVPDTTYDYKIDYKNDSTKIILIKIQCGYNGNALKRDLPPKIVLDSKIGYNF